MPLQSTEFKGDQRLEACLIDPAAHLTRGVSGDFVLKVQKALMQMGFAIAEDEQSQKLYGQTTADAVLRFKERWEIINRSYQNNADEIVGQMTIRELDEALQSKLYFALPRPSVVSQANPYWCWAASLASWLEVSRPGSPSQEDLIRDFAPWEDPANGGLREDGWGEVSKRYDLEAALFSPGSSLTAAFLQDKLKNHGFVLLVFTLDSLPGVSHTNVGYGVRVRTSGSFVRVMDPTAPGRLLERPMDYYTHRRSVGVMWDRRSLPPP